MNRTLARLAPAALVIATLGFPTGAAASPAATGRPLTLEERVQAQRAIEEVYWQHRTWPKENRTPKPPLSAVLSDAAIRAKVEDYLRKSNALETWWQRPVTGRQLQAELDRISRSTRDPEMLRELYAALSNDPFLLAETLARPALVDRLIRNWYASDDRFHGEVERSAREAVAGVSPAGEMPVIGGEYTTSVYRLADEAEQGNGERVVRFNAEEWSDWSSQLAAWFGEADAGSVPLNLPSALQEDADRYFIVALLARAPDEMTVGMVTWAKRPFDAWWAKESGQLGLDVETDDDALTMDAPTGAGCVEDTWQNRFYAPGGRYSHTAVWTGTEMIIWGGGSRTGGRYDPATDSWTPTSTGANVPAARYDHTAVWTGTEMIVWGGWVDVGSYFNSGGCYNPANDSWRPTSEGLSARSGHTAVWTGTEMVVWGGYRYVPPDDPSNPEDQGWEVWYDSGGRYDPATDSWAPTSRGANVPSGRDSHTAVWTGDEMIVWGGHRYAPGPFPYEGEYVSLNTGGRYDPATDSWLPTSTGANVPTARSGHTAVWTGAEMIVWGSDQNPGGRYDAATDSWIPVPTAANFASYRASHTAVWTGTEMIVWGGVSTTRQNMGARYRPATNSWTLTSTAANVPSPRVFHTAVWTGSEMIVWGGWGDLPKLGTGGRYDPSTDSWMPTSAGPPRPSERIHHTAVWTGTEMIVWGGNPFVALNSGGRYDPATDNWTPTSTGANVPTARSGHTAVWTGTAMVVWGGRYDSLRLNTGGRYDPATDNWTPTSIGANVPAARVGHTAVWTGTQMIVCGGSENDPDPLSSIGGRYDPSTDSWTPMSTAANFTSGPFRHSAVWTGTEMIIWGGWEPDPLYGRYDPSTDSWTPMSTDANAPTARSGHTAVWTGTEMIVWGGNGSTFEDAGARYDPSTDSWTPMSSLPNAPTARSAHTAVWTGTEMIIWGGWEPDPPYTIGGRYDPSTDTWTPMSTDANAPTARIDHTAVWTGTQMIVWGGTPDENNEMYLYCASGCQVPTAMWRDVDSDGFGDPSARADNWACTPPPDWADNDDDCADSSAGTHPGAVDVPGNLIDEDCTGTATCDPSAPWRNHGAFVACVARECNGLVENSIVTSSACGAVVSAAAMSSVGKR